MNWGIKLLLLTAGTVWFSILVIPDNKLHVIFCDVGQGDAALIMLGTNQILIDGGPDDKVISCLSNHLPFWDRTIEIAIATHKQSDHEFGLTKVKERYQIISYEPVLRQGQTVMVGKFLKYKVWSPNSRILGINTLGKSNNDGIVGSIVYKEFNAFFAADVDPKMYENIDKMNIIKVPHHGSKYQWNNDWYARYSPNLAIISVGKNNYGHPAQEVITGLNNLGIKYLRTDEKGSIEIISDGLKWWVK